ncbi:hypothetical protein ONS95_000214 [Cadophora gregata]|uniref:uncharacterized protein n=1 Tax=Cadophora gregata TaxID=51156 RepID=UPI0026DB572D|nr:uncharacterized protein ONS95_000214 [Cadophora gregata]KAK0115508.1 hypothetical protein ONS96_013962 [Cadophora gregata f. sp. sojae]KAK0128237.1 hypothetical protein ONS95_000214 [Cadophora gregata]
MSTSIEEEEAQKRAEWRAEQIRQLRIDSRFSFPFGMRLPIATSISFVSGLVLGMSHGSQMAGFRFRAENAHRLPTTPTGWYLYHKSKNYNMALGGVKEGLKMGAKVSFWTAGFFSIEEMFDRYRGTKDFINTVIASLSIAGGFSLWNRFPITTAARTAKTSLAIGLAYGLAQDAVGAARGRPLGWVDFIRRGGRRKEANTRADTQSTGTSQLA